MEKPDKRRKYDAAFRAEALRVVGESRSTPAAARSLNLDPKLLYKWQRDAQPALPADPAEAAEVRQLRQRLPRPASRPQLPTLTESPGRVPGQRPG